MKNYDFWTTSEVITMKNGILPHGRTITACRRFCYRNGIKFPGKKVLDINAGILKACEERSRYEEPQTK